jgi:hypothetical protein
MGLPVIATNYSGPAAYLTGKNSYLIPPLDHLDHLGFAIPDFVALKRSMEQVVLDSVTEYDGSNDDSFVNHGCRCKTVACLKGHEARSTSISFSADSAVKMMADRLRVHASRRGWIL